MDAHTLTCLHEFEFEVHQVDFKGDVLSVGSECARCHRIVGFLYSPMNAYTMKDDRAGLMLG